MLGRRQAEILGALAEGQHSMSALRVRLGANTYAQRNLLHFALARLERQGRIQITGRHGGGTLATGACMVALVEPVAAACLGTDARRAGVAELAALADRMR